MTQNQNLKRAEAYSAIDSERDYQDRLWPQDGQPGVPNPLTIGEFVLLLSEYVDKAKAEWTAEKKPEGRTLEIVRKIAGIAVNCMEQHGAPRRVLPNENYMEQHNALVRKG